MLPTSESPGGDNSAKSPVNNVVVSRKAQKNERVGEISEKQIIKCYRAGSTLSI